MPRLKSGNPANLCLSKITRVGGGAEYLFFLQEPDNFRVQEIRGGSQVPGQESSTREVTGLGFSWAEWQSCLSFSEQATFSKCHKTHQPYLLNLPMAIAPSLLP